MGSAKIEARIFRKNRATGLDMFTVAGRCYKNSFFVACNPQKRIAPSKSLKILSDADIFKIRKDS
jgi:hypothetical protein